MSLTVNVVAVNGASIAPVISIVSNGLGTKV